MQWAVVDPSEVERATQILTVHANGLAHLSETLASDVKALDTICNGLEGVKLVGVKGPGGASIAGGGRPRESL